MNYVSKAIIFLYFSLSVLPSHASDYDIELLWKARALKANETLEPLVKKNGDSKGKNLKKEELCKWRMENAYMAHMFPDLAKTVKEKSNDFIVFKLLFIDSDKMYAQVNFTYKKGSSKPTSTHILMLQNDASAGILNEYQNILVIKYNKCAVGIPMDDPLNPNSFATN